jgi:SAM-dependent methyltransferase
VMDIQKSLIYVVIIIIACLITLFTFDTWETFGLVCILLICLSYIFILAIDKLTPLNYSTIREGFVTESAAAASKYEWLSNDDLFDDFYASVFTKLTQNENLIQAETAVCLEEFAKNTKKDQLIILDAGCGIGIGTIALAKQGVGMTVGIDKSQAMIRYAKGTTVPNSTLNDSQKQDIEFRTFDLVGPGVLPQPNLLMPCYYILQYIILKILTISFAISLYG